LTAHLASVLAAAAVGATLLVSAVSKLASRDWPAQAAALGVGRPLARAVPLLELVIGALLVAGVARHVVGWVAVALLVSFTALLVARLLQGSRPVCACFGRLSRRPIGWPTIARNAVLIGLAASGSFR
jgi:uncharacterized membrane protein YphA (DoxX/SURF4 family)